MAAPTSQPTSRRVPSDGGFTIIESVVALTIIFGLLLVLVRTFDSGVSVVVESNRRSAANALASELMERARSLEWQHMGLTSNANGDACPDGVGCVSHPASVADQITVNANGNYAMDNEEIVFANGDTFDPFLSFAETVTRDDVEFTRYLFVTSIRTDPLDPTTEQYRRITAVVRWSSANGFPEEIRLATLVAEFVEPSQPYIYGEVGFDGGSFSVAGSDARCGGDPDCGAFVQGTSDWLGGTPRDDVRVDLFGPLAFVSATTDYVAQASFRTSGSFADVRWAGVDGILNTADDVLSSWEPTELSVFTDDDASSTPGLNSPGSVAVPLNPPFQITGAAPRDLVVADLLVSGDLDLATVPSHDTTEVLGESWTRHDTDPGPAVTDGQPYAAVTVDAPETVRVGFREYADAALRTYYKTLLGQPLNEAAYDFEFVRTGDGVADPSLVFDATVDRYDDPSGYRQVHTEYSWKGEQIRLFDDDVIRNQPGSAAFEGWVRITLPFIYDAVDLMAGESAAYPPGITVSGDLVVEFWDGSARSYVVAFNGYSGLECSASGGEVSFTSVFGGPQSLTTGAAKHPHLTYVVDAEFTVWPYCSDYSLNAGFDVASANAIISDLITGSVSYSVVDDLVAAATGDGLLYDLEVGVDAGGVSAATIFVDPEA